MKAAYCHYRLDFIAPAITSRSVMLHKDTYFIKVWDENDPEIYGVGECALFRGLGADDRPDYENCLSGLCRNINTNCYVGSLEEWSSILFGYETAVNDLANGGKHNPFPSPWCEGACELPINGLVWMGDAFQMRERIKQKLDGGFRCIKIKIGGINFDDELQLLKYIRDCFSPESLELRLDANGAFTSRNAMDRLERLAEYHIHSIEQPVKQGQWETMSRICQSSPIPIALDEELIGITTETDKVALLDTIRPQYIILKPSLCGGFKSADRWIALADERDIGWWATSALESNIGLNAIAQWVSRHPVDRPQGLGTGMLYANNIESPLQQTRDVLVFNPARQWHLPLMEWIEP